MNSGKTTHQICPGCNNSYPPEHFESRASGAAMRPPTRFCIDCRNRNESQQQYRKRYKEAATEAAAAEIVRKKREAEAVCRKCGVEKDPSEGDFINCRECRAKHRIKAKGSKEIQIPIIKNVGKKSGVFPSKRTSIIPNPDIWARNNPLPQKPSGFNNSTRDTPHSIGVPQSLWVTPPVLRTRPSSVFKTSKPAVISILPEEYNFSGLEEWAPPHGGKKRKSKKRKSKKRKSKKRKSRKRKIFRK